MSGNRRAIQPSRTSVSTAIANRAAHQAQSRLSDISANNTSDNANRLNVMMFGRLRLFSRGGADAVMFDRSLGCHGYRFGYPCSAINHTVTQSRNRGTQA